MYYNIVLYRSQSSRHSAVTLIVERSDETKQRSVHWVQLESEQPGRSHLTPPLPKRSIALDTWGKNLPRPTTILLRRPTGHFK